MHKSWMAEILLKKQSALHINLEYSRVWELVIKNNFSLNTFVVKES